MIVKNGPLPCKARSPASGCWRVPAERKPPRVGPVRHGAESLCGTLPQSPSPQSGSSLPGALRRSVTVSRRRFPGGLENLNPRPVAPCLLAARRLLGRLQTRAPLADGLRCHRGDGMEEPPDRLLLPILLRFHRESPHPPRPFLRRPCRRRQLLRNRPPSGVPVQPRWPRQTC